MAQTDNIAEMLQSLLAGLNAGNGGETQNNANQAFNTGESAEGGDFSDTETSGGSENFGGTGPSGGTGAFGGFDFNSFFGNIDIDMIMKIGELFAVFNQPDKNAELLRALKPHMRDENKEKIDTAIKILKITSLLPYLRESGFMDKIF